MLTLWLHRYSLVSYGLCFANLYVSFVVMRTGYWGTPFDYRSGLQGEIAWLPLLLGFMSVGLAGLALKKEPASWVPRVALGVSVWAFFICMLRHAV
jgi:hypothetical protein